METTEKRKPLHTRTIVIDTFDAGGGFLEIEGRLTDERTRPFVIHATGEQRGPGILHGMSVAMRVSVPELRICAVRAEMPDVPVPACRKIRKSIDALTDLSFRAGFTDQVKERLGKTRGCLHLNQLIIEMASAAVQGMWAYYGSMRCRDDAAASGIDASLVIDTCWLWRAGGPLARRLSGRKGGGAADGGLSPVAEFAGEDRRPAGREDGMSGRTKAPVITIDGPAGAGKSSVCRQVAEMLGYLCLDTGALYRAAAWTVRAQGIPQEDIARVVRCVHQMQLSVVPSAHGMRVRVDGRDVSDDLRTEEIGMLASALSAIPGIREALLPVQRRLGEAGGIVAEGRDMGTVVFPDADCKIYLDASLEERIHRRIEELQNTGMSVDKPRVAEAMARRDMQDRGRKASPLTVPPGAAVIDTTGLPLSQVVEAVMGRIGTNWGKRCT